MGRRELRNNDLLCTDCTLDAPPRTTIESDGINLGGVHPEINYGNSANSISDDGRLALLANIPEEQLCQNQVFFPTVFAWDGTTEVGDPHS